MVAAAVAEVEACLSMFPLSSAAWKDSILAARLSVEAVMQFLETMSRDGASPMREAEAGMLGKEILRLNQERGVAGCGPDESGRLTVRLKEALSPAEQTSVLRLCNRFCAPVFQPTEKFGRNGHVVMHAVRKCTNAYLVSRIPPGASILEVGPDVASWVTAKSPLQWAGTRRGMYKGARPVLTPRDTVRMDWAGLVKSIRRSPNWYSEEVCDKTGVLESSYSDFFSFKKIQGVEFRAEYIYSGDANYDVDFDDMPAAMVACGARCWLGVLNRAKGLTSVTRLKNGRLPEMGSSFFVDWQEDRIDFRYEKCNAFGYSHKVSEYLKYEEYNGYVWTSARAHYVYSKGPECTAELLFFSVFRVPTVMSMQEPSYVEHPMAGRLRLESVWACGEEQGGVPRKFSQVVFHVDALNFSKVLEKRRTMDFKGDLMASMCLVRSTNVRFWLNGTPVGASEKIEARLAEATAVVVETLAHERRLESNMAFDRAMFEHSVVLERGSVFYRMLASVFDVRALSGKVAGSVMRLWHGLRDPLVDAALSMIQEMRVSVRVEPHHMVLPARGHGRVGSPGVVGNPSDCVCGELAEARVALNFLEGPERAEVETYVESLGCCTVCTAAVDKGFSRVGADDGSCDSVSQVETSSESDTEDECGDTTSLIGSVTSVSEVSMDSFSQDEFLETDEFKSMTEYCALQRYLVKSQLSELALDSARLFARGVPSHKDLLEASTTRVKHAVLEFFSGRCVSRRGYSVESVGAMVRPADGVLIPVEARGGVFRARIADGFYYTCNRLRVWNAPDLISAVQHVLDEGLARKMRHRFNVTVGVPGAGKTYGMMRSLADRWEARDADIVEGRFLCLAVTKASVGEAEAYGIAFGMPKALLRGRLMTLDSYLMHCKRKAAVLSVDEFPMDHIGKIDAAVCYSRAEVVNLYGDARQVTYDPFCAEFPMVHGKLGRSVPLGRIKFIGTTHRNPRSVCAAFVDMYPYYTPCDCCEHKRADGPCLSWRRVETVASETVKPDQRVHAYRQDDKEEMKSVLGMRGSPEELRARKVGGLATVAEDQGSSHDSVVAFRPFDVYDKNASGRNPSLFNRVSYVLTDITRIRRSYEYVTACAENDEVIKRIEYSRDPDRLRAVDMGEGIGDVSLWDFFE